MNELDEDDATQFPWPLWLPVMVWIGHGLGLIAFIVWRVSVDSDPIDSTSTYLLLFPGAFGLWVISVGVNLFRGRGHSLTFVKTFSLGIAIGTFIIVLVVRDYIFERARLIIGYECLIFTACATLAI